MPLLKSLAVSARAYRHTPCDIQLPRSLSLATNSSTRRHTICHSVRTFSASTMIQDPFKPAKRVAGQRQDVWSIVNEAAAAYNQEHGANSVVNMGTSTKDKISGIGSPIRRPGLLRLQPARVRSRRSTRCAEQSRLQSVFAYQGTTCQQRSLPVLPSTNGTQ